MFFQKCGGKISVGDDFCKSCGVAISNNEEMDKGIHSSASISKQNLEKMMWYRAVKIIYIGSYAFSIIGIAVVTISIGDFSFGTIAFLILWFIASLIKNGFFYIVLNEKPKIRF